MNNYILKTAVLLVLVFASLVTKAQEQIYVDPNGNDSNPGTIEQPLKTMIGARNKVREIKSSGLPAGGVVVNFREGRYPVTSTCEMGSEDSGESDSPIVYTGYNDEEVIFDGSLFLNPEKFEPTTSAHADILHSSAVGNVYVQKISDITIYNLLITHTAQMSMNDRMMTISRYPNLGYGHVNDATIDASNEQNNTEGSSSNPVGASFKMIENINAAKWNSELQRVKRAAVNGYMSADWKKEFLRIADVGTDGRIYLMDGVFYGLKDRSSPNRFFVSHMLCELDEPGEWYFDITDRMLYIWPYEEITTESKIGVWAGPEMVLVNNGQHIQFKRMVVQCLGEGSNGDGALNFRSGSDFLVAGVTFRYIADPLLSCNFWQDVRDSKMLSCNFFDVWNNTRLYGGGYTPSGDITVGNNSIENCHFSQIYSKDLYGKACGMSGVGNIFRNNLIHNMNGQPVTHAGLDHLIELNELFNVGIEEGDGGAIYCGANIMDYGNILRHNFIHHVMCVPKLTSRNAIHHDGHNGGKDTYENVFYKGGHSGVRMASGAGHNVTNNVFLNQHTGIFTRDGEAMGHYAPAMDHLMNRNGKTIDSNSSSNYIGRMLKAMGKPGWKDNVTEFNWYDQIDDFWKQRYPVFDKCMKAMFDNKIITTYECNFIGNMNWDLAYDIELTGAFANIADSRDINLSVFENPDNLNFKFNSSAPSYAPDIPFENIGLYLDEYRCAVPDKDEYRRAIKQRFEGQESSGGSYDPATINQRLYYNSGKMVLSLVPCQKAYVQENFYFDMGTTTSVLAAEYERVSNTTLAGPFGWTNTDNLNAADRSEFTGLTALTQDLVYCAEPKTFEVNLPNGKYKVLLTFGDARYSHDNITVKAQGETRLSNINTQKGDNFIDEEFEVEVTNSKLSLEFSDGGGTDPDWVVNRLVITKKNLTTAVSEVKALGNVNLYPNPVDEILNIDIETKFTKGISQLMIYCINGNLRVRRELNAGHNEINVAGFSSGVFVVCIRNGDGLSTHKFIKR